MVTMKNLLTAKLSNDDAAVTVDWVVMTAAVVLLAIGAIAALNDSPRGVAEETAGLVDSFRLEKFGE